MQGELAAHLADAVGDLGGRAEDLAGELLADADLDLVGLQRFLDRVAGLVAGLLLGRLLLHHVGLALGLQLLRDGVAGEGEHAAEGGEGQRRQAGHDGEHEHQRGGDEEGARIGAELADDRPLGGTARAPLGDEEAGSEGDDEGGDLGDESVADREAGEDVGGAG